MENNLKKLSNEDLAYIAGFLDGDGCLLAQIVRGNTYKYKYTIRLSIVFFQKKDKHWYMLQLQKLLGVGTIRFRNDNMIELAITGDNLVKVLLKHLHPYLRLKKLLSELFFEIIEKKPVVKNEVDFIEVCKLIDRVANHTYSKKRMNTSFSVMKTLGLPVETEK